MWSRDESEAYLAGLGTVGMEILEQMPKVEAVVVPAAGQYGLLAGTAAAIKHLNPQIAVIVSVPAEARLFPPLAFICCRPASFDVCSGLYPTGGGARRFPSAAPVPENGQPRQGHAQQPQQAALRR